MTDLAGPWDDYAPTAPTAAVDQLSTQAEPMPVPHPIELAQPGTTAPGPAAADDGPWNDYAAPAADTRNLPIAPTAHNGTESGFADTLPTQASHKMSAQDEMTYSNMLKTADAPTLKQFAWDHGGFVQPGIDDYIAARDHARAQGKPVSYDVTYALPKIENTDGTSGAAARGVGRGATANFLDEAGAVVDSLGGTKGRPNVWNSDKGFGDLYDRNVDYNRAILGADDQDHPYASLGGELAGGLAVPLGLEKAGVTATMDSVGLAARNAALMEGHTDIEAAAIARRAIAKRAVAEGAAYGGAYGTGGADGGPEQRLAGGVTGALAGAALPIAATALAPITRPILSRGSDAVNAVYNAGRKMLAPFTREGAQDTAASVLRGAATRPVDDIVSEIRRAPDAVDGVQPTLAEVAQDPGLAGLQRGHANTDPNTAAAIGERNASNALARTRAVSDSLGDGTPQAIQDYAAGRLSTAEQATADQQAARQSGIDNRISATQDKAGRARGDAESNLSSAVEALGPTADRDATGAAARDAFDDAYEGAKQKARDAYADPALTKPIPLKIPQGVFAKLRDAADDFYGDGGGEIPARLQSVLSDMADPNATTRTLTNIDRRLADFAGEARMQGRRSEAAFAERVRGDLGNFAQQAAPPEYRAALTNAKAVRAEQGRIFETGDAPNAFARDRYSNPVVGNNTIPTRLVRPGAAGGDTAEGLIQAIGPDRAENIVRQEIRRAADERGIQTAAQARALSVRYGEAARRFPAVQADLENLQRHATALDTSRGIETRAISAKPTPEEQAAVKERAALHDRILASPLGRAADPSVDPSSFVGELLRRADQGRRLKVLIGQIKGQPDAESGLRRALGDYIADAGKGPNFTASGDRVPSINKTRTAIATVMARGGDALTSQQKLVLRLVNRELESANFAATASKPAGSETAINQSFKDLMGFVPGITGKTKFILGKVLSALGNGDEVKRLVTQSILEPDFAATLLKRPTEAHWSKVQNGLAGRKLTVGGAIVGQPANDTFGLHEILSKALRQSPGRAAAGNNVGNGGQIPPDQRRQADARQ
jgi:hypothetical protein